jgi:endogenous inhibitor of DNA gyrase (YacG/DUF329 family)
MASTPKSERGGLRCPICRAPVAPLAENAAFPFCTERCQTIDLGAWLGGDYRVPAEPAPGDGGGSDDQGDDGAAQR